MKPGSFAFAHLSDPHLPLAPGDSRTLGLLGKRITGYLSWTRNRRHIHRPETLEALIRDVREHDPDHVAVTGDLANISTSGEFARAQAWLEGLGQAEDVTVVPGNHDAYVRPGPDGGFLRWSDNMRGDGAAPGAKASFPFVRRRGPVAFIGLSTANPTAFFMAYGALGAQQIEALDAHLDALDQEGACRVVLLHHPPAGRQAARFRKGLHDREAFARVIAARGAELILHGHTHHWALEWLPGPAGGVPVLSAASASAAAARGAEPCNWNLVRVEGEPGDWRLSATVRGQMRGASAFHTLRETQLSASA